MSNDPYTYGEIRKKIEVKMNKEIGMDASQEQIQKIRELAPEVAEGKMTYEAAMQQVQDLDD